MNQLTSLRGYEAWKKIDIDLATLDKYAVECASWVYSGVHMISPHYAQQLLREGTFISHLFRILVTFHLLIDPDYINRMVNDFRKDALKSSEAVKMCQHRDDPSITIRFVRTKSEIKKMSSTKVRAIIRSTSPKLLLEKLKQFVMYPEILTQILSDRPQHYRTHSVWSLR